MCLFTNNNINYSQNVLIIYIYIDSFTYVNISLSYNVFR